MKKEIKESVNRRLAIIEGQVHGLRQMVDKEEYCVDIITQIEAVREALSGVGDLVLRNHLETHVVHEIKNGSTDRATGEILKIYKLAKK